jgi:hypothetical protein
MMPTMTHKKPELRIDDSLFLFFANLSGQVEKIIHKSTPGSDLKQERFRPYEF